MSTDVIISERHPLRQLFRGLVSDTFLRQLHAGDPDLAEYLADLLTQFVHVDNIFRIRDARGRRLEEVAEMLVEANARLGGASFDREREIHKHIGDFTLFWTGVYPEALRHLQAQTRKDHLLDYVSRGRHSYYIASRLTSPRLREESRVLRELSEFFEVCVYGLHLVRQRWEHLAESSARQARDILLS
ncbi:MAG: hypothetical protein ACE5O2_05480 [Armatimonadota bacterium]